MPKPCVVPNCKTGYKTRYAKRSVFKVPNDEERRKKWASLIPGISVLKPTQFVCDRHFHRDYVIRKYIKHDNTGKLIAEVPFKHPYLTADAVPTIFTAEDDESSLANETITFVKVEHDVSGEQNYSTTMEVGTDVIMRETMQLTNDPLSIDSVYNEASYIDRFGDETNRTNEICSQLEPSIENYPSMGLSVCKLEVLSTGCVGDGSGSISLPETWSVSKSIVKHGTEITFCRIVTLAENGTKSLIIKKFFIIENWTGHIQYYVHGKQVCIDNSPLPHILQDASSLPVILATFERIRICQGTGSANSSLINNGAFQDQSHSWHHGQCALVTKNKMCGSCKTLKNTLWRRKNRAINQSGVKRGSCISNPHQMKLNVLQRKLKAQREKLNRARRGIQSLKTALEQQQAGDVAFKFDTRRKMLES